jgi:hypothetical protein
LPSLACGVDHGIACTTATFSGAEFRSYWLGPASFSPSCVVNVGHGCFTIISNDGRIAAFGESLLFLPAAPVIVGHDEHRVSDVSVSSFS